MGPNDKVIVAAISGFLVEAVFYALIFLLFEHASVSDALGAALVLTVLRRLYFFFKKKA